MSQSNETTKTKVPEIILFSYFLADSRWHVGFAGYYTIGYWLFYKYTTSVIIPLLLTYNEEF